MPVKIVAMEREHIPALAEIERQCFSVPWSESMLEGELDNPLAAYVVALDGGFALGYAGCQMVLDEGSIMNIAVRPERQRLRIGKMLLEAIIGLARDKNIAVLTLEVRKSNEAARRLYEKSGFLPVGLRKNYYHNPEEDGLVLALSLKEKDE